ncbi:MAG: hypothetical protein OXF56_11065 [Rhodobacteraceae bacterium]|nr:hypothetical protein [Paracoccaceae bacterium]
MISTEASRLRSPIGGISVAVAGRARGARMGGQCGHMHRTETPGGVLAHARVLGRASTDSDTARRERGEPGAGKVAGLCNTARSRSFAGSIARGVCGMAGFGFPVRPSGLFTAS